VSRIQPWELLYLIPLGAALWWFAFRPISRWVDDKIDRFFGRL
jgi:hypothetical protein